MLAFIYSIQRLKTTKTAQHWTVKVVQKLKVGNGCTKAQMDAKNTVVKDPDVLTTRCDSVCITDLKMINPPKRDSDYAGIGWEGVVTVQGWGEERQSLQGWGGKG